MMKSWDPTRLGGIILALTLAMALAACSAIRLGYANLPNLAYWWLDGYVDFSEEQAPAAREELARLHAWHRQQELPQLLELLARMEQAATGEISPQQACTFLGEVQQRLKVVQERAEGPVVAIASTLTARELRHMQRKFRRNNERFQKEWIHVPREEQVDKRFERTLERFETIYGRLEAPQRAALRQRLDQSVYDPARSHAEWQRRQQDLLAVLRRIGQRGAPEPDARSLVRGWLARIERAPDAGYRAYQDALRQEGCATFAAVHQGTNAAQRDQAVRRLRAYQRDLRELMAQP
jgi:hypothetical protein